MLVESQQYQSTKGFEASSGKRLKRRYLCRYLELSYWPILLEDNLYLQQCGCYHPSHAVGLSASEKSVKQRNGVGRCEQLASLPGSTKLDRPSPSARRGTRVAARCFQSGVSRHSTGFPRPGAVVLCRRCCEGRDARTMRLALPFIAMALAASVGTAERANI
jgi:hypothetical protein